MSSKSTVAALAAAVLALLVFAPGVSAFKVISEPGEGAGKTRAPGGLAVDFETGRLYVADRNNNRVDVFGPTGAFVKAFGWGVKTGATEFEVCTSSCRAGLPGAGIGQFSRPTGIAVDNSPTSTSRHDIYVVDYENNRVEKFDPEGNFILAFGGGVDKTVPGNVCTAASSHACGAGSNGFGEGELSNASNEGGIFVGVGPAGTIYVIDSNREGSTSFSSRLQKFEPSGAGIAPQHILSTELAVALAVDSTGDFYVVSGNNNPIHKYGESGEPISLIEGRVFALAVDSADNLFAAANEDVNPGVRQNIVEYEPSGTTLRRFGYGTFQRITRGLAPYHSVSGDVYASEEEHANFPPFGSRVLHLDFSPPGPVVLPEPCAASPLGNTKATLNAEVNPEGKATTYHFQYVDDEHFKAGGFSNPATKTSPESASIGADFTLHKASAEVEVLPETKYHCRVVATNSDASGVNGPEGVFTTKEPFEILDTWSTGVGFEAATLHATVNPLAVPTNGYFEYIEDATFQKDIAELGPGHGFDHAARAPLAPEELDFGAGEAPKSASAQVSGLSPGTLYRYRIVVDDHLIPARSGPTKALRTFAIGAGALPDNRAYELVSPAQKESAEVGVPGVAGGLFIVEGTPRIQAAAGSGEAIAYTSWTAFGDAKSAPSSSQYLSKRTAGGWGTENISPFGFLTDPVRPPYRGFTPDLGFGAFVTSEPPLTPEAQAGFENLYLRNSQTGQLQALTIQAPVPGEGDGFCAGYAGASADGQHAIFAANAAMAGAPLGKGFSLYEWSPAGLALVSVLPDGTPAPPVKGGSTGQGTGFGAVGGNCSAAHAIVRNAISEDGSVVFWTYGGTYKSSERPLLARIDGAETIQIDAKTAGEKNGGKGKFWAATGDGAKAFFTAPGKLATGAKAENQLYRYDTVARTLIDLTPGAVDPEIEGVIGASEDGAYAYFVAKGALTGSQENAAHEKAKEGANNLYLWHEGEGLRFIAALSELDQRDWGSAPNELTARITPSGRHLAFLSVETKALSGYDNTISSGIHCQPEVDNSLGRDPRCPEAYLYDAEANALTCASCNPSGAKPAGPTELPFWSNPYEGPRYLSDDGSRLYFESRDVLSGADENGKRDVYEFEPAGAGSCTNQSPDFDPTSGGCLFLISSGKSTDESFLLDASADGRDAFLSTRQPLTGWDTNENYDVYDARVGGGFPEPPPIPQICAGEACKPPVSAPRATSAPATPSFQGPGNAAEKPKAKKHKSKKHKHKAKRKHGRAHHRRGAGR
jgi:DNA-binding beta-propeller fold protein YncE